MLGVLRTEPYRLLNAERMIRDDDKNLLLGALNIRKAQFYVNKKDYYIKLHLLRPEGIINPVLD